MMSVWKKARKKPVTIEFREVEPKEFLEDLQDMGEKIRTLEGILLASSTWDFIIKGVRGELYPIKKEIFYETYDVIEEV